jgi:phosphonate transport system permease protein
MKNNSIDVLSPAGYRQRATVFGLIAIGVASTSLYMGFDPSMLFTEFHYVVDLFHSMAPPNIPVIWTDHSVGMAVLETVSMCFLGTLIGCSVGMGLAFLSAENTMPILWVRWPVRTFLSFARVLPPLFVILVLVATVGLGPFAGMLALVITTMGTFGQLFSNIIENTEAAPADAIYSVGATRWQVIRYVILPQVLPAFTANTFYAFDLNMRVAIGIGIFGGGGVGFQLFQAMRILHYHDALALILLTMLLIIGSEKLSDLLRSRLLHKGPLK